MEHTFRDGRYDVSSQDDQSQPPCVHTGWTNTYPNTRHITACTTKQPASHEWVHDNIPTTHNSNQHHNLPHITPATQTHTYTYIHAQIYTTKTTTNNNNNTTYPQSEYMTPAVRVRMDEGSTLHRDTILAASRCREWQRGPVWSHLRGPISHAYTEALTEGGVLLRGDRCPKPTTNHTQQQQHCPQACVCAHCPTLSDG